MDSNEKLICQIIGARFRQGRHSAGLTQDDVAVGIGVDRRHYGRIESGQSKVSVIRLIQICIVLELDPAPLITRLKEVLENESKH